MKPQAVYERVRRHCQAKPRAVEEYPWGDVVWKVGGKIFAGSADGSNRVTVKSTLDEQARLIEHPSIEVAKYVGRYGWVTVTVDARETLDLALELIDESYAAVAPRRRKSGA